MASLTGSIIGNLLLVMGASVLLGGLRHGTQTFSARLAGANAALLVLALIGLFVPAIFALTTSDRSVGTLTEESVLVAIVLIIGYVLSLIFQFTHPDVTLAIDGETNWLEGALLMLVYVILAVSFFEFVGAVGR